MLSHLTRSPHQLRDPFPVPLGELALSPAPSRRDPHLAIAMVTALRARARSCNSSPQPAVAGAAVVRPPGKGNKWGSMGRPTSPPSPEDPRDAVPLMAFLARGRLRPLARVNVLRLMREGQRSAWCNPTRLDPLKLECVTSAGALRFATAEDMERYLGLLPNIRSENFRCFCTEWIFEPSLVECTQCHHRMHLKCYRKWSHRRRICPYCQAPEAEKGSILQPGPNVAVDLQICSPATD